MENDICYVRTLKTVKPKVTYRYMALDGTGEPKNTEIYKLNKIIVPPTYTDVVICPNRKTHATGYDSTRHKQYFYNKEYVQFRTYEKYCNLLDLGQNIDTINNDIDRLLEQGVTGFLNQEVIDALALRVMIICNFRIGSKKNVDQYGTYGLSTITRDHVKISGNTAHIKFIGKKKRLNECLINDAEIVKFLEVLSKNREKLDKNGYQSLFKINGFCVTPNSLNIFLSKYSKNITSKTWRTWYANVGYIEKLNTFDIPVTKKDRVKLNNSVIKEMADELHHTSAINKRSYLLPDLPEIYINDPATWVEITDENDYNKIFEKILDKFCTIG